MEAVIGHLLEDNRHTLTQLKSRQVPSLDWHSGPGQIQSMLEMLHQTFSLVSHLHSVADTDELRSAYNACLSRITAYYSELGQDKSLYALYEEASGREDALSTAQQAVIRESLRDFQQAGVNLPEKPRQCIRDIDKQLSHLQASFEQNLLDATDSWRKPMRDESRLSGLPQSTRDRAKYDAEAAGQEDAWLLTLQDPCYQAVISYADDADLRREFYDAHVVRASERQDPDRWDNGPTMAEIVSLRDQRARYLGYDSYAASILCHRMAGTPEHALTFLRELAEKAKPIALKEQDQLSRFALADGNITDLQAWDIPYYREKMRRQQYDISQEDIRCYFPAQRVLAGLFDIVSRLFGITVQEETGAFSRWHEDVRLFHIDDARIVSDLFIWICMQDKANVVVPGWMTVVTATRQRGRSPIHWPF